MSEMTRRTLFSAAGMASVAVGFWVGTLAAEEAKSEAPRHFQSIPPRELFQRRHLPNVELITHQGKTVHFYDDLVKDKIVVINFIYAKCEKICPPITANLVKVQKLLADRIGKDIFMYSITLKPQEDTPADLKQYAEMFGVGPGWLFLTGKPADVEFLRKSLGFKFADPAEDADKTNHIGMVRVGTEPLMRWFACEGLARAEWIAKQIRNEAEFPFVGGLKQENAVAAAR
jgi:protein SCO1/2